MLVAGIDDVIETKDINYFRIASNLQRILSENSFGFENKVICILPVIELQCSSFEQR